MPHLRHKWERSVMVFRTTAVRADYNELRYCCVDNKDYVDTDTVTVAEYSRSVVVE